MKWFKHDTDSHDNPDISDAMDEFGDAGYSVFFILLEIYGRKFKTLNSEGELNLSWKYLALKLRKKRKRIELLFSFYQKRQRIFSRPDPENPNRIFIKIPQFIEIASNWTGRKEKKPTEVPTEDPTAIEGEEEVEVDKRIYIVIFDRWNEKKIVVHKKLTDKIKRKINGLLDDGYTEEEILAAIDNYAIVLKGSQYNWTHKWCLEDFLARGVKKFVPAVEPLKNYLNRSGPGQGRPQGPQAEMNRCPECRAYYIPGEDHQCGRQT